MLKITEEKIYFQVFWSAGACIYEKCLGYSETKSLRGRDDERKNCRFERF